MTAPPGPDPAVTAEAPPPIGAEREFTTDFSLHSVDYAEILSGGPPKDGIPAIDQPKFESVQAAGSWLSPQEPVVALVEGDQARAYPIQILTWHEIVNDTIGGRPVLVTFCPLCNTAIAFDRTVDGTTLDFGTTGRLRYSNLIMYDRQTESWWQQASGEAIAGEFTGIQLQFLPATMISWQEFAQLYPGGSVLSQDTGYSRPYGRNPYSGYDDIHRSPFLYVGPPTPGQLPAMARVLAVELNGEAVAFPYQELETAGIVNEAVGGQPIVVFWQPGAVSALDQDAIAEGRPVGSASAYLRRLGDQILTFATDGETITDQETGSRWDSLGRAVEGELTGAALTPVVSINHFWFSWAAFKPETRIYQP